MPSPTQTPLLGTDKPPSAWAYWPFFVLGVLNNASYVLMLASATEIASSGIAMVYLVVNLPGLVVKASAPYFFEQVSYRARAVGCGAAMATALLHSSTHVPARSTFTLSSSMSDGSSDCRAACGGGGGGVAG